MDTEKRIDYLEKELGRLLGWIQSTESRIAFGDGVFGSRDCLRSSY